MSSTIHNEFLGLSPKRSLMRVDTVFHQLRIGRAGMGEMIDLEESSGDEIESELLSELYPMLIFKPQNGTDERLMQGNNPVLNTPHLGREHLFLLGENRCTGLQEGGEQRSRFAVQPLLDGLHRDLCTTQQALGHLHQVLIKRTDVSSCLLALEVEGSHSRLPFLFATDEHLPSSAPELPQSMDESAHHLRQEPAVGGGGDVSRHAGGIRDHLMASSPRSLAHIGLDGCTFELLQDIFCQSSSKLRQRGGIRNIRRPCVPSAEMLESDVDA